MFGRKKIKIKSEKELIVLAKKDSCYFGPIYKKYYEQIFRFIYQRIDREEDAEDITARVFFKALINLNKYQFKGFPFLSWLYKIALNEINQFYRKNKKQRTVNIYSEKDLKVIFDEKETDFDEEKRKKLLKTLENLAEEKMTLIEMRFFEKRSYKEIGEILNITENNAKVRTYRALDEMKKNML